jgi:diguanylate cyclase (GGDEF)-like protein
LQAALLKLSAALSQPVSQSEVIDITRSVQDELKSWSENASKLFEQRACSVQEVLHMAGTAAQQVGERDKRYTRRFTEFGDRLQATSRLGDVVVIRQALGQHSADLKSYVAQMVKDSEETIGQLRSQLANYEFRLDEMEHLASQDALTGLSNRRKVEREIEVRIRSGQTFSVISLDLNGFKQLNDTYGHLAGDDLLTQFAVELRTVFRSYDVVGRMGGDEFIALLDADISVANAKLDRIRHWVNGSYSVKGNPGASKVKVTAAAGAAQWSPGETMQPRR